MRFSWLVRTQPEDLPTFVAIRFGAGGRTRNLLVLVALLRGTVVWAYNVSSKDPLRRREAECGDLEISESDNEQKESFGVDVIGL